MIDGILILSVIILILILSIDDLTPTQLYIKYSLIILVIYLTVNTQTNWICGGGSRFKDVQYYKNIFVSFPCRICNIYWAYMFLN